MDYFAILIGINSIDIIIVLTIREMVTIWNYIIFTTVANSMPLLTDLITPAVDNLLINKRNKHLKILSCYWISAVVLSNIHILPNICIIVSVPNWEWILSEWGYFQSFWERVLLVDLQKMDRVLLKRLI